MEDNGVFSPRLIEATWDDQRFDHLDSAVRHLELLVSNTCDLACRYCASSHSSVWAERLQDDNWQKTALRNLQEQDRYNALLAETYDWIAQRMDRWDAISLTGGEVAIMPRFYEIIDRIPFNGKLIKMMTNLNTPDAYMDKLVAVIGKLTAAGNRVEIRASIDGIGAKNDWQRQGADWARMERNWMRLAKQPAQIYVALTMTPLTLEGMVDVGKFVADTAGAFVNPPCWEPCNHVQHPQVLDPRGWYGRFRDDVLEFRDLITSPGVHNVGTMSQIDEWLADDGAVSAQRVGAMTEWLDEQQARWGGGSWRDIYPRVWAQCQELS